LLELVGVTPDKISADYELSRDPVRDEFLAREHSSVQGAILGALEGLNLDSCLRMGGAGQDDLAAVRRRLLGQAIQLPIPWQQFTGIRATMD
jgi:hypothetical protein